MKKLYLLIIICAAFCVSSFAQTSVTATYNSGDKALDRIFGTATTSQVSTCAATLNVLVPAGRYVVGIDVEYDLTSIGNNWQQEQSSYLECVSTSTKEASITPGPNVNSAGTASYTRNGLNFANGVVGAGGSIQFTLHAFKSFGTTCNISEAKIDNNTFKITVRHVAAPTCLPPSAPLATAPGTNSINLDWTTGGATTWEVEYGAPGFTIGTGTRVAVLSKPFSLTGLSSSTDYEYVVRDSCAVGDVSFWSARKQFRTSCAPKTVPFTENFDGSDWSVAGFNSLGTIDTCWSRNYQNVFTWVKGLPAFNNNNSGPSADHTTGSGNYIYTDRVNFGPTPFTAQIQSPYIDLGALTAPQLTFFYHAFGASIGNLSVQITNDFGLTYTNLSSINGPQHFNKNDPWNESILDLSAYVGDTIAIRFSMLQSINSTLSEFAIDDFNVAQAPSCPKPQNFAVDNAWITNATFSFTALSASSYHFEYGAPGYTFGTGTRSVLTGNPATLTGLTANTTYDVYMRSICAPGDSSLWIGPLTFKTQCNPTPAPYTQNFDGTDFTAATSNSAIGTINNCFSRSDSSGQFVWRTAPAPFNVFNSGPEFDHTLGTAAGKFLRSDLLGFTGGVNSTFFSTELIDLSTITNPQLVFWTHMFGSDISSLQVDIITKNGATNIYSLSGQQQTTRTQPWKEVVLQLGAYANDSVSFRFTSNRFGNQINSRIAIDDISVEVAPSCPKSQNLMFVSSTSSTATLSWISGGSANAQIEYGAPGFTLGTGTKVAVTTNPATVTGLTPNTTYDFYVRDSCGANDFSAWTISATGRTQCVAVLAPFSENFDGTNFAPSTAFNLRSTIDACWEIDTSSRYEWATGTTGSGNFNTGPATDHTTGSGNFLFSDRIFGFSSIDGINTTVESPLIDCTPLTIPELQFYYHMFGNQIDSLVVDVFDGTTWSQVWFAAGAQQTTGSDPWLEANIDLAAYTTNTIKVRFRAVGTAIFSFNNNVAIDDFKIREQPTCPKPSNLTVVSNTINSIDLSWTTGGATNWIIEYGPTGFTKGSGTFVAANSNPFTLTGLTGGISYDIYLRDSCGVADVSDWTPSVLGNTTCAPLLAPYFQNFEGADFVRPVAFNDSGSFPVCWERSATSSQRYFWDVGEPVFNNNFTGPSGDHTSGTGKYAYVESGFGAGNAPFTARLLTPQIDLSALTTPQLSFWYHMFGSGIGTMQVEINNGTGFTNLVTYTGAQQISNTEVWKEQILDLSAYANDTIQLRFLADKPTNSTLANAAIDDIEIKEAPSCPKPQVLQVLGTTATTAQLSFTSGGAANWEVEYGAPGFALGSGTRVALATNPGTVTGLTANTNYEFYVRDSCAVGDVSDWSNVARAKTACTAVMAPYFENFDGTNFTVATGFGSRSTLDPCWKADTSTRFEWAVGNSTSGGFNSGPSGDFTTGSGKYLFSDRIFGFSNVDALSTTVESPLIDCSSLTTPELQFYYHMFGNQIDSLVVDVFDGTSWTQEWFLAGQQQTSASAPWQEAIVDISAYANTTIKVRIRAVSTILFANSNNMAIDNFRIREQPNCPKPSNLNFVSGTSTSATIGWTTGGATNWIIEYGAVGFTKGTGTFIAANSNPFIITGLTPGATYQMYLRDSCGVADVSDWTSAFQFSTVCTPIPAPWFEDFEAINFVQPSATAFGDSGSFPVCWNRTSSGTRYFWAVSPPSFPNTFTGPSGDHTTGSGKYASSESGFGFATAPFTTRLETPQIDLSTLTTPELSFWYHLFGNGIGTITVEINNGSGYTTLTTYTGQQQTAQTDAWLEEIVDLSAYANDTISLRFVAARANFSTASDASFDDIDIHEAPSCPKPSSIVKLGTTTTTAQFSWTSTGTPVGYEIEYGPVGFALGAGTTVTATTLPFTVTGLTPDTRYDFYLRDECTVGDFSDWSVPIPDTTKCNIYTAPYSENFDGNEFAAPASFNDPGIVSQCFVRTPITPFFFTTGQNGTSSFNTGPSADHTSGTGKFLHSEGFDNQASSANLEIPLVDVTGITSPELRFWYHMFGTNIGSLKVEGWNKNTNTWQQLNIITGQQQTSNAAAWQERVVSLSALPSDTIALRFVATRASGFGTRHDMAIDDVWIGETPTCTRPSNLAFVSATVNSITVSWTSGGAANALIKHRPSGSTAPFTFVPVTTSPAIISGLTASTNYEIYLADSCGAADISLYEGALLANTSCGTGTIPFNENFESGSWISGTGFFNTNDQISPCWTRSSTTNSRWSTRSGATQSFNTGPSQGVNNGKYIFLVNTSFSTSTIDVESSQIQIPTGAVDPRLYFNYHMFGNNIDSFAIQVQNGTTWSGNVFSLVGQQQSSKAAAWKLDSLDLNNYKGSTIRFRLRGYVSGGNCNIAIDEMLVKEQVIPCTSASNLAISNITPAGADITWTQGSSFSNVIVVAAGGAISTGTVYSNVTSPYALTGLLPNTAYDIYVQDSCGVGLVSTPVQIALTTTPCPAVTAALSTSSTGLSVNFNTGTSLNADSTYITFGDGNFSSLPPFSNVYATPGRYTISVYAFNNCGTSDTVFDTLQVCEVLNAAFTFTQNGSNVYFDASTSNGAAGYNWTFGDGTTGAGMLDTNVYASTGTFTVGLQVYNLCGDTLSVTQIIQVCVKPVVSWTYTIIGTSGAGMEVQFDASASTNASTFDWNFGDGNTAVGTAVPLHIYLVPSLNYRVTCIATNACGGKDTLSFKLNQIGLDENVLSNLVKVYPVPANEKVTISFNPVVVEVSSLKLYDATGKIILGQPIAPNTDEVILEMNNLPAGMYQLQMFGKTGIVNKKIQVIK